MKKYSLDIFLAYFIEVVLAISVLFLIYYYLGTGKITAMMHDLSPDFYKLTIGFFSASVAVWVLYFNYSKPDSDFGEWLHDRGADKVFNLAFIVSILINTAATISLILCSKYNTTTICFSSLFLLILSVINVYSLIKNARGLIILSHVFKKMNSKKD